MPTATQKPTQLEYKDRDGIVVITPEDEDRFTITVDAAIQACRIFHEQTRIFHVQFKQMLRRLAEWLTKHTNDVGEAYLTVRDTDLLFLVVKKAPRYDEAFEDDLTDLDIEIAQDPDLNLIRLSVLAIPNASPDAVESFLVPGKTVVYRHAE